ncbi:hypothetical protein HNY73_010918 [Argiope bruennichi]|uniref:Uncharacterized protein n=1 Tax=Argiope bruennichi TaxID=94029 RepID=A0A8T0F7E8_ARGBR|nr:hypothetical protein HNY73_010918 [Argiope bruennichi]
MTAQSTIAPVIDIGHFSRRADWIRCINFPTRKQRSAELQSRVVSFFQWSHSGFTGHHLDTTHQQVFGICSTHTAPKAASEASLNHEAL